MQGKTEPPSPTPEAPRKNPEAGGYYPFSKTPKGVILAVGLGFFVQSRFRAERATVEDELRTALALKVYQLIAWQKERMGDAAVVAHLPGLAEAITDLSASPSSSPPHLAEIDASLNAARVAYGYQAITLLDRALRPVRGYPAEHPWNGIMSAENRNELLRANAGPDNSRGVLLEDLRMEANSVICMHLLVKIRSASGALAGVVVLSIDAQSSLFPLIESWPVETQTAETLLLRREGDSLLSLSPTRFQPDSALKLRRPLSSPNLLAANALRAGPGILVSGEDYRGKSVIGLIMTVPNSPWLMVSKMDQSEAYATAWREFWQLTAALVFLLMMLVLFGRFWLHLRQTHHISQRLDSERKRRLAAERLAVVMRNAHDIILVFDETMRIVDANERAISTYGYTQDELRKLSASSLRAEDESDSTAADFATAQTDAGITFRTVHRRKDGTTFPVEVSSQPVLMDGRRQVMSIIRDISERKAHELEIERLNRIYHVISEVNQVLVRAKSREELFNEVCRVIVEKGQFQMAWIGWLNPKTHVVEPVAVAGDSSGYTTGLKIATNPGNPEGLGPSGTAFRENRMYVCNDFFSDPATGPWRESATRVGFKASIALPLTEDGETLGLLTVYAREKGFFRPRKIELMKETADDISFALGIFARERRRRAAEAALKASETRLNFLISATPAIIYSLRAGGDFATTFISPNVRDVLGYEPAELLGDPGFWAKHVHPNDLSSSMTLVADLNTTSTFTRDYRFRHANGSWRWMHDEMRVSRDVHGNPAELVGYWFDITERKVVEEALRTREEIFSNIVGQAGDAIALVAVETGRFLEFNRSAYEGLGYTREEFAGFGIGDIQADHSAEEIKSNIEQILRTGGATFESRHRCRDGSLRDVRISAKRLRLQGRDCITAIWSDITESKRVQDELRKLSRAVEQSPATIVITNLVGEIEYVNPRFTERTGYSAEEVIGLNPRLLKSGITSPEVYADLWRTITEGHVWRGEIVNRTKNGENFTELCIISPVTDTQGRPTHYLAIKEDITERLKTEAKVRQLSRTIEQAPLSVAITDLSGAIEYVNPSFLATTGYTYEEVMGQNPRVLKSGLTPATTYTEMWQTLNRGEVWRGELSNKKKDGTIYEERAVIAPVTDEAGKITHYVALKEDVTEKKRAENALREIQERYRLVAENTSDVIWLYDFAKEGFTYASPSVYKMLGRTPEELASCKLLDLLTPESATQMARVLAERLARFGSGVEAARVQVDEVDQVHKDGRVIPTEVSSTLLTDSSGKVAQILGVGRDITERRRTESKLRESEARYRELFDLESDAILLIEADSGRILRANQAAGALYGRTVAELETLTNLDLSAEPDATRTINLQAGRVAGKVLHIPQGLHKRSDGTIFPVEISLRSLFKDGQWFHLSAIRDITLQVAARETLERFNAELEHRVIERTEELASRTRHVQALLDAIPDTIMRVRTDGSILDSQPARQGSPELASITPAAGVPPPAGPSTDLLRAAVDLGESALVQGSTVMGEVEVTLPQGKLFLELRTAPTGSDEFVVFARDITARKRLETETVAMLEKERQVSEMRTRFISVTSHEFRTPMAAAMGSVDLLINHFDRITESKRQELFDRITSSLHRMTDMLDDVLLLNRMDSNRIPVAMTEVQLQHELHAFIDEIRLGDRDAHVFDFRVTGSVENFVTDQNLLHHISSNLLSNAVRYSPAGSTITVTIEGDAERVTLRVRDQGIGIPEKDRSRIFEPFERGSNVGNIKGTGLGLNIVKRMTEMLGGTIAAEAAQPVGTCFILTLPRLKLAQ